MSSYINNRGMRDDLAALTRRADEFFSMLTTMRAELPPGDLRFRTTLALEHVRDACRHLQLAHEQASRRVA